VSVTVDGITVLDSVVYEPFGPNGGWKWGNSTVSIPNTHTRVFDKDFRLTRVTSDLPASGSQPYFDKQVGWDIQSRVASITDLANSALSATYGFDALDRLTSASQGSNTWSYSYNGTGDRLTSTVNSATTNYGYASGTHRLQSLSGAQSKSYSVDAAGNMTSDGTNTWVYGGNNRPTTAASLTVLVNALGQRVKKDNGTSATRFVYDEAGRLWGEYSNTGALIQETVWLDDLPVATLRPNGSGVDIFYVHADHLGTPRAITRPSDNQLRWKWDNTEGFGNSAPDENPNSLGNFAYNLRFPGQYFDAETGKHYNYYRDYDSSLGRYLQSDPIGLAGGINTYSYVDSRPLLLSDPSGLAPGRNPGLPRTDDCKRSEWNQCDQQCASKGGAAGCYVTVSWKFRGLRGGNPIRSEERTVNCRCKNDDDGPACGKGCQLGLLIGGLCLLCALQPELCVPAGLGLGLGY
jgi:RHS repeat-associated protein